jgi:tRNA threonylcarbamoyl adenosine modification protein YeaZ
LGIETCGVIVSAAVARYANGGFGDDRKDNQAVECLSCLSMNTRTEGIRHSNTLFSLIDAACKEADVAVSGLDMIAVTVGPGSFTGVRIGVSAAKGIALALNIPVIPVSSLLAMYFCAEESLWRSDSVISAVKDARRGQYYNALFRSGKRLTPDRVIDYGDLDEELSRYDKVTVVDETMAQANGVILAGCSALGEAVPQSAGDMLPIYLRGI